MGVAVCGDGLSALAFRPDPEEAAHEIRGVVGGGWPFGRVAVGSFPDHEHPAHDGPALAARRRGPGRPRGDRAVAILRPPDPEDLGEHVAGPEVPPGWK